MLLTSMHKARKDADERKERVRLLPRYEEGALSVNSEAKLTLILETKVCLRLGD
jgi:hypothetical protein